MENKNLGIILTITTIILCGLPGLISICSGVIFVFTTPNFEDPALGVLLALSTLCIGLIFIAIPIVVGFFTFRKPSQNVEILSPDEPIPPPS